MVGYCMVNRYTQPQPNLLALWSKTVYRFVLVPFFFNLVFRVRSTMFSSLNRITGGLSYKLVHFSEGIYKAIVLFLLGSIYWLPCASHSMYKIPVDIEYL